MMRQAISASNDKRHAYPYQQSAKQNLPLRCVRFKTLFLYAHTYPYASSLTHFCFKVE